MMNKRIKKLREQSLNARPSISSERALLITDFYKSDVVSRVSIPVQRAMAFKHLLENKKIHVNKGELIVGERGPGPKATPTYPEICAHSVKDLDILNARELSTSLKREKKFTVLRIFLLVLQLVVPAIWLPVNPVLVKHFSLVPTTPIAMLSSMHLNNFRQNILIILKHVSKFKFLIVSFHS